MPTSSATRWAGREEIGSEEIAFKGNDPIGRVCGVCWVQAASFKRFVVKRACAGSNDF